MARASLGFSPLPKLNLFHHQNQSSRLSLSLPSAVHVNTAATSSAAVAMPEDQPPPHSSLEIIGAGGLEARSWPPSRPSPGRTTRFRSSDGTATSRPSSPPSSGLSPTSGSAASASARRTTAPSRSFGFLMMSAPCRLTLRFLSFWFVDFFVPLMFCLVAEKIALAR